MIILGISESHEAHACIIKNGVVIAIMAEERLTRLKSDSRYPRMAIDSVLKSSGISPDQIDAVAFAASSEHVWRTVYNKHALFSVRDWIEECEHFWKPALLEGKKVNRIEVFDRFQHLGGDDFGKNPYHPFLQQVKVTPSEQWEALGDEIRVKTIFEHLRIPADRIHNFRHEDCHKAYGFFSSPYDQEKAIVFTLEGGGDDSSATVSIAGPTGEIVETWKSNDVQAGRLYAYVTLILGMKPGQHEYKVMGLAPYGTEYHGKNSLEFFRTVNRVDGTKIVNDGHVPDLYYTVKDALEGERFDGIAWGLQTWLEELVCEWVANNCREHGIGNVIFSGGVSQNIKVTKAISEMPEVQQVWSGPVSGDGSLGIGAAWLAQRKLEPGSDIEGLPSVYLGSQYTNSEIREAVEKNNLAAKFHVIDKPNLDQAAGWLISGLVVARYSGRMEFGQRALGNRSILADPRNMKSIDHINQKIKYRDFWMPFTPTMTVECAEEIVENPKSLYSPFMTMAFDLVQEYKDSIPAGTHPSDNTIRPQMLKREVNPEYYDLLQAFGRLSGIECLLNTSFNLHGEAIVESPEDAISTFERSELDVLLFDDIAVCRNQP